MRMPYKLFIISGFIFSISLFSGCEQEKDNITDKDVQFETLDISDEDAKNFSLEMTEAEKYMGISDTSKLLNFYNLDNEEENSSLVKSLMNSFPVNENMQYFTTINEDLYLLYVKKVDEKYHEMVYNTSNGKYGIMIYDDLESSVINEAGTDNVEREITSFYLVSENNRQYAGKSIKNISPSETINILKKYKGITEISDHENWDNPKEFLEKYYSEEYGMQHDFKYTAIVEDKIYLCTINCVPEGYCLTYYDPVKDWFEVCMFKYLLRADSDSGFSYYLTNDENAELKKNSLTDWKNDGFVCITE